MAGAGSTPTVAEAETLLFATDVALTVTVSAEETPAGALYVVAVVDVLVNVPQAEPAQPLPDTLHETPWLLESLVTLAVKFTVCPWSMLC